MARLKYRVGDMVFSYANPTKKCRISKTFQNDRGYPNSYIIALTDDEGYSYSSKYIDEKSISKRRKQTY